MLPTEVSSSRVVAVVQARMTSTRLPGKVLADFGGKPLLEYMLARVRRAEQLDAVYVATTFNASDNPVYELCEKLGVPVFRGDEHDVLSRYVAVAAKSNAAVVVRLTADCPFVDPEVIDAAVRLLIDQQYDYVSNAIERSYPDGLDVEVFTRAALRQADVASRSAFQREHVTPYLRSGAFPDAGKFKVGHLIGPADFSHLRWTVDTEADLAHASRLAARLPNDCSWMEVIALLSRRPDLLGRAPAPQLELRRANALDLDLLFDWVNSPEALAGKLETIGPIGRREHEQWFSTRIDAKDCKIWIAQRGGCPVGQVRAECDRLGQAHVDIFVAPEARAAGIATAMIDEMAREVAKIWPDVRLVARVRLENKGSRRLFNKAGFSVIETKSDHLVMSRNL